VALHSQAGLTGSTPVGLHTQAGSNGLSVGVDRFKLADEISDRGPFGQAGLTAPSPDW
jgi:hypothetical protein